jgi:uncharacterized protein
MNSILRTLLVFILLAAAGFAEDDFAVTKKKAEAGDAAAQFNLGVMYAYGTAVPKASLEAVKWYRKAAEQGNVAGMLFLGFMYSNGEGLPKDYAEAVKWYRLAANQGDCTAQHNLGNSYKRGDGVPKNLVQAHVWLNIAAANGGGESSKTQLEDVEKEMTYEQKAEAMKLARELFAKLPKGK